MKCEVPGCNKEAVSQIRFIVLPIKIDNMCLDHGKEYIEGEKFLVEFVR